MIDQALHGFLSVFDLGSLSVMLIGIPIGILIGILPGIGGPAGLVLALPFIYNISPNEALVLLLSMHSVCATGGGITAILFNIPGEGYSAATLLDGFPMAQKGEAGRAIGALVTSSAVGGVFGGIVLVGCVFIVRPIVIAVGLPEYFFIILIGLSLIVTLGSESIVKGLISGLLGIFISFIGSSVITGEPRFWFGSYYLLSGFGMIQVALGLFALPMVFELLIGKGAIAKTKSSDIRSGLVWEGVKDVFRNFKTLTLGSIIGTVVGIIPGVGAQVATFMSYGIAKSISKHPETFGLGNVEGVIAPEAADNAKEGGALLPTLALGIPGSMSMAILLGAFMLVGLQPGPFFLKEHADIAFQLAGTIILANIIAAFIVALIGGKLATLTFVRGSIMGPIVLILVVLGGFSVSGQMFDLVAIFLFGILGYGMQVYGYNRPSFIIGFILGDMAERYFGLCMRTYGPLFFLRPFPLISILLISFILFGRPLKAHLKKKRAK